MAYVITEPCIDVKDGTCLTVCPVDCIAGKEEDSQFFIDPELCVDCDVCVSVCPVDAIYREDELPEEWAHFAQINRDYFHKKQEEMSQ
jgi:NAD-dependent dihydropyrimidine dehydrogenase PreA subunit